MISRIHWVLLIEVNVRVEHSVPDCHEARVVAHVLRVVEDVVRSVSAERNQSEDAPREFVATVTVVSFKDSDKSPLHDGKEMELWTEDKHTEH